MSGFHPILGLLAVAVCISLDAGEAFPFILSNEYRASKLRELNSDMPRLEERHNIVQVRSLNKNPEQASLTVDDDQQVGGISSRNTAYKKQPSGFDKVTNLRTTGKNSLRSQVAAAEDTSGSIDDESTRNGRFLSSGGSAQYSENESSSPEESNENIAEGPSDSDNLDTAVSASKESCEDENESEPSTKDTPGAITSSTASTPTKQNDNSSADPATIPDRPENGSQEECEEIESPSVGSGSASESKSQESKVRESEECEESGGSTSQGQQTEVPGNEQNPGTEASKSEECEETEEPNNEVTSTTSKKPHKKPTHSDESWDSVSETEEGGHRLSGSSSAETTGESIDASWRR